MGWWSTDIMGGDTPLDCKDTLYGILGTEEFEMENGKPKQVFLQPEQFTDEAIIEYFKKTNEHMALEDQSIAYQVLAVIMMAAGARISDDLMHEIMDNIVCDEWALTDSERQAKIKELFETLQEYDGTPTIIKSKGLFDVIAEKLGK